MFLLHVNKATNCNNLKAIDEFSVSSSERKSILLSLQFRNKPLLSFPSASIFFSVKVVVEKNTNKTNQQGP